jgi:hypothetical protein
MITIAEMRVCMPLLLEFGKAVDCAIPKNNVEMAELAFRTLKLILEAAEKARGCDQASARY